MFGGDQILGGLGISSPSIIKSIDFLPISCLKRGEICTDKRVRISQRPIFIINIAMPNLIQYLPNYFMIPLIFYRFPPFVVKLLNPQQEIALLICWVNLFPLGQVNHLNSLPSFPQTNCFLYQKLKHNLAWILCEDVVGGLPGRN